MPGPTMNQYHEGMYGPNTPLALIEFFERELAQKEVYLGFHRVRKVSIQYGNTLSGKAYVDKPVTGYIGIDPDNPKQLTIKRVGAKQAQFVLVNNIVRVTAGGSVLYRHPLFHTHAEAPPTITEETNTGERALRRVAIGRHGSSSQTET